MGATREELALQVDVAEWGWLRPHGERGGLIVVSALLDLAEVALDEPAHRGAHPLFRQSTHLEEAFFQGGEFRLEMPRLFAVVVHGRASRLGNKVPGPGDAYPNRPVT